MLTKYISWKYKCKFDGKKCNPNQKLNKDNCRCECKNLRKHHVCKKGFIWDPATCSCEIGKYLASINEDSMIMCDEIIEKKQELFQHVLMKKDNL